MKLHNYLIGFVSVFVAIFIFYNFVTQRSSAYNRTNIEYANDLTAACHDAAKTINLDNLEINEGVWQNQKEMEFTLQIFYETLSRNFGASAELKAQQMKDQTPCVVLVDTDGFYISFNAVYDEYNNAVIPNSFEGTNVITDINTWTEQVDNCIVRYYLSDYIQVTTNTGKVFAGNRKRVYQDMIAAGMLTSNMTYLVDDVKFDESKNHTIISKLEKQINYFINTQFINVSDYNTGYNITLPELTGEEWSRMIKSPCVIAFMQGNQESVNGNLLNVYAYAAGEISAKYLYVIDNGYYYRLDGNSITTNETTVTINGTTTTVTEYLFNGTPISNFYTSMEECAALGAVPAPDEY